MPKVGEKIKFRTILADPPWPETTSWNRRKSGKIKWAYDLMSYAEIDALPVQTLVADSAHLYLWATYRSVRHAFVTAEAWGFEFKYLLTWCKAIGLGSHFRSSSEFLLFATRGSILEVKRRDVGTWFHGKRTEHSKKPEEAYQIIESVSPGPYLELFARREREGWAAWGNEIRNDVELNGTFSA